MNTYIAIWNKQRIQLEAKTSYEAQQLAQKAFQADTRKKVKGYDIIITLVAKEGKEVIHSTGGL